MSDDEKRAYLEATGAACAICSGVMLWRDADMQALNSWAEENNSDYPNHPRYATVEHIIPYADAPHLERERSNMTMAHRACNKGRASFAERQLGRLTELMASDDVKVELMSTLPVTFADVQRP